MKALIKKDAGSYWKVRVADKHQWFLSFDAAQAWMQKETKRWYKESSAFSMVTEVVLCVCNVDEHEFVMALRKSKCKGITMKQYGYLKGIHERQQREW